MLYTYRSLAKMGETDFLGILIGIVIFVIFALIAIFNVVYVGDFGKNAYPAPITSHSISAAVPLVWYGLHKNGIANMNESEKHWLTGIFIVSLILLIFTIIVLYADDISALYARIIAGVPVFVTCVAGGLTGVAIFIDSM